MAETFIEQKKAILSSRKHRSHYFTNTYKFSLINLSIDAIFAT